MIKYKVDTYSHGNPISAVEAERENLYSIWIKGKRFSRNDSEKIWVEGEEYSKANNVAYFDSFRDAKAWLVLYYINKTDVMAATLNGEKSFLRQLKALQRPLTEEERRKR